jgi:uncharacterized protein with FMN-binding domain
MLKPGAKTGRLAAQLLASAALVLLSGAYAGWEQTHEAPAQGRTSKFRSLTATPRPAALAPASGRAEELPMAAMPSTAQAPAGRAVVEAHEDPARVLQSPQPEDSPASKGVADTRARLDDDLKKSEADIASSDSKFSNRQFGATMPEENRAPPSPPPIQFAITAPDPVEPRQHPAYADGDFTGESFDCNWGPVQVEVHVASGVITDVKLPLMPDHRRRSAEISDWSEPIFQREAIQAQDANVDIVSSATNTSVAFQQALNSALDKARK